MAEIVKAGEFATEGEQRAAGELVSLPADWIVVCNKVLLTSKSSIRAFKGECAILEA